ncbi:hypothetical protein AAHC03_01206 [Spirometra sp. Aus1]
MRTRLLRYFAATTGILPGHLLSMDVSRLTLLYFGVGGLAVLGGLSEIDKQHLIDFIYAHQIAPSNAFGDSRCGFRGSTFIGAPLNLDGETKHTQPLPYDASHVTMTYSALNTLLILGDDLSRVNRDAVMAGILALQSENANFINASLLCHEFDARFVFSAVASAYIVDQLDKLDIEAYIRFITKSLTFEGGFAHLPNLEAHAGATYCNLACLKLFGKLDSVFPENSRQRERLISWLLQRQKVGFNGRSGKDDDSCYTFWVGACLQMLHMDPFIDRDKLLQFITTTWDPMVGGFMRSPDANYVDPLHSFLTVSGLSTLLLGPARTKRSQTDLTATLEDLRLTAGSSKVFTDLLDLIYGVGGDEDKCHEQQSPGTVQGLEFVVPELNIPQSAFDRLKEIHRRWRSIEGAGLASWQR